MHHSKELAAAACVLVAGLAVGSHATQAGTAPCDATIPGTELRYGMAGPNAAFDPIGTSGSFVGGTENAAVWDVLFTYDEASGTVVPHLAESITPNDDFTVWTLKIRSGISYSDGTPFTAQLVSDNVERFLAPDGVRNAAGGYLSIIADRTVIDDTTLEFSLSTAFAEFPQVFTDEPGEIVNLNAIGDDLDAFRVQPPAAAGLGPYVVESNIPGEETVLRARDDYWGGPVCIETIRFTWNPDVSATYAAFQNGELDAAMLRDPAVVAQVQDDGVDAYVYEQNYASQLYFNHRDGHATANPLVREAIALAVDPNVINDRAFEGTLTAGTTLVGPDSPFWSEAMVGLEPDVERASELVEQAKAEGWDGRVSLVSSTAGVGPDTALAVEGMLGAVGIEVLQDPVPAADIATRLNSGEFDMITNTMPVGSDSALLAVVRYFSSSSPSNRIGYSSDAMDALVTEALASPYADLPSVMARINDQINADTPLLQYGTTSDALVWADNVSGLVVTYSSVVLFHEATMS